MCLIFPNLPSCPTSLAVGLVPTGRHYYRGSAYSAGRVKGLHTAESSLLISIELQNIPSRITLLPFRSPQFVTLPRLVTVRAAPPTAGMMPADLRSSSGRGVKSEVRELPGHSPTGLAKLSSLTLRTALSPLVASHLSC